jgi:hypothetical protein
LRHPFDDSSRRRHLVDHGVDASAVDERSWGRIVTFADPDGNSWTLQQIVPQAA